MVSSCCFSRTATTKRQQERIFISVSKKCYNNNQKLQQQRQWPPYFINNNNNNKRFVSTLLLSSSPRRNVSIMLSSSVPSTPNFPSSSSSSSSSSLISLYHSTSFVSSSSSSSPTTTPPSSTSTGSTNIKKKKASGMEYYSSSSLLHRKKTNRVADREDFQYSSSNNDESKNDSNNNNNNNDDPPGSKAFLECDRAAVIDLFHKHAFYKTHDGDVVVNDHVLDKDGLRKILKAIGENPDEATLNRLYNAADLDGNGFIELDEFLHSSDMILGGAPAGIVLVVGGPGSGKGLLSKRLVKECGVVHLSSGELLREEVRRGTVLGNEVKEIMSKGELVSSAVIVTLMRRRMRNHPGKRVLLDGFPRSPQNAHDLIELCGKPELALHLDCDDTILLERILARGKQAKVASEESKQQEGQEEGQDEENNNNNDTENGENESTTTTTTTSTAVDAPREDDNVHTAITRLRTYHKYHHSTMEWLRENHVPVVNLDCSGTAENVWEQLTSIGRLMRPAVVIQKAATIPTPPEVSSGVLTSNNNNNNNGASSSSSDNKTEAA